MFVGTLGVDCRNHLRIVSLNPRVWTRSDVRPRDSVFVLYVYVKGWPHTTRPRRTVDRLYFGHGVETKPDLQLEATLA